MDESTQERLFAENPGRISPPEPGLYIGTSGWSYADWAGSVYSEGLPAAARLAEYANHYATVESWREIVPEGFLFSAKFPQEFCKSPTNALTLTVVAVRWRKRDAFLLWLILWPRGSQWVCVYLY
jgi:uncharacterized protein YecE (DUF72 family)